MGVPLSVYEWEGVVGWLGSGEPQSIARAHGIRIIRVPYQRVDGMLAWVDGVPTIGVRASARDPRWTVAHELGHYGLLRCGVENTEDGANYIAGAILMPSIEFRERLRQVGPDPVQLALPFDVSQSAAMLRLGEVDGRPLALVAPLSVRVRGPEEWVWPDEQALRAAAATGLPGLAKVRLRDDRRRVALVG